MTHRMEERAAYLIASSHLDVQWLWTIQDSIRCYIPATIEMNCDLIEKHLDRPDGQGYVFSFEGSFRYMLAKEYFPALYERLRRVIRDTGRWHLAGGAVVASDVAVPSPEALIRQLLYGNGFFKREFGRKSVDVFLPDCFGFPHSLPSIAAHCGRIGFSTQKLTWEIAQNRDGGDVPKNYVPFDVEEWIGPDGASILAALQPGPYEKEVPKILPDGLRPTVRQTLQQHDGEGHPWPYVKGPWAKRLSERIDATGIGATFCYFGIGDQGGSPGETSVANVIDSAGQSEPFLVRNTGSGDFFTMLKDDSERRAALPRVDAEHLMAVHGTGCYTSETAMKRWNRMNEQLGDAAERAAVQADWLGGLRYPHETLQDAWIRFLAHQFHDDLTGTSIPDVYPFSWNDEVLALNRFSSVLETSVGAIAAGLDTTAKGTPVVVYNPLSIERIDVVEADLMFPASAPSAVRVFDSEGREVRSQLRVDDAGGDPVRKVCFVATVPAVGFAVFDVRPADAPCELPSPLTVSDSRLENDRYALTVNERGDLSSIIDKTDNHRELLDRPAGPTFLAQRGSRWPAWEIMPEDAQGAPLDADWTRVEIRSIAGLVRATLEIRRQRRDGTSFCDRIHLYAEGVSRDHIVIESEVDWTSDGTLLKATFPLTVANDHATYDLGWGVAERTTNRYTWGSDIEDPRSVASYEVPGQQWADLTDRAGTYGVAVLTAGKYGWDKPTDNEMRLTLIHTPPGKDGFEQRDFGPNRWTYAICGHANGWQLAGISQRAAAFNQPLRAFRAASHDGPLGRRHSFVEIDTDQVLLMALKKREPEAERGDHDCDTVIRLRELHGTAAAGVTVRLGQGIAAAREVNGEEDDLGPVEIVNGSLVLDFERFQTRTIAVDLLPPDDGVSIDTPRSQPISLDPNTADCGCMFDANVVWPNGSIDDEGRALPPSLFPATVAVRGIRFELGPKHAENAIRCTGQEIAVPEGSFNRIYVLAAASSQDDCEAVFHVGDRPESRTIPSMTEHIGQWYDHGLRILDPAPPLGSAPGFTKHPPVAWYATHLMITGDSRLALRAPKPPDDTAYQRNECAFACAPFADRIAHVLPYEFAYMFLIRFDLEGSGPWPLRLPKDDQVLVFAATAARNENDNTASAVRLYD